MPPPTVIPPAVQSTEQTTPEHEHPEYAESFSANLPPTPEAPHSRKRLFPGSSEPSSIAKRSAPETNERMVFPGGSGQHFLKPVLTGQSTRTIDDELGDDSDNEDPSALDTGMTQEVEHIYLEDGDDDRDRDDLLKTIEGVERRFTPNQMAIMRGDKTEEETEWTDEEMLLALRTYYIGGETWDLLTKDYKIPIPTQDQLKSTLQKVNFNKGLLTQMIKILGHHTRNMTKFERLTVLVIDEMNVIDKMELDKERQEIVGPHKRVITVVARGLYSDFVLPIYLAFDKTILKKEIDEILKALSENGLTVVCLSSDAALNNRSWWMGLCNQKQIFNYSHPFFYSDILEREIYIFPDVPHLIFLMRKAWFDELLKYDDKKLTLEPLQEAIDDAKLTNDELHAKILNILHANKATSNFCCKTKSIGQLFSHQIADFTEKYSPGYDQKENLVNFLRVMANWFRLANSFKDPERLIESAEPCKIVFTNSVEQQDVLKEMDSLLINLKVNTQRARLLELFQMYNISLVKLTETLKTEFPEEFVGIETYKLNTEILEWMFLEIRKDSAGTITPMEFMTQFRKMLFGQIQRKADESNKFQKTTGNAEHLVPIMTLRTFGIEQENQNQENIPTSNSKSSNSNMSLETVFEDQNDDLQSYNSILVKLAEIYQDRYPHLVNAEDPTLQQLHPEHVEYFNLSMGIGCSTEFTGLGAQMETYFRKFHGETLKRKTTKIIDRLAAVIFEKLGHRLPLEVIHSFLEMRTEVRLMHLNATGQSKIRKTWGNPRLNVKQNQ